MPAWFGSVLNAPANRRPATRERGVARSQDAEELVGAGRRAADFLMVGDDRVRAEDVVGVRCALATSAPSKTMDLASSTVKVVPSM
jgi:hypothetical protein